MLPAEKIEAALRQQPFQPFRLHLAEGRTLPVVQPATASVVAGVVNVGIYARGSMKGKEAPEFYERVALDQIDAIEPFPETVPEARTVPPADVLVALRARPFLPFRIVLEDGRTYDIPHPELCMVGLESMVVGVVEPDHAPLYRITHTVSMRHIIRLEPLPGTQPTNGQAQPAG